MGHHGAPPALPVDQPFPGQIIQCPLGGDPRDAVIAGNVMFAGQDIAITQFAAQNFLAEDDIEPVIERRRPLATKRAVMAGAVGRIPVPVRACGDALTATRITPAPISVGARRHPVPDLVHGRRIARVMSYCYMNMSLGLLTGPATL